MQSDVGNEVGELTEEGGYRLLSSLTFSLSAKKMFKPLEGRNSVILLALIQNHSGFVENRL